MGACETIATTHMIEIWGWGSPYVYNEAGIGVWSCSQGRYSANSSTSILGLRCMTMHAQLGSASTCIHIPNAFISDCSSLGNNRGSSLVYQVSLSVGPNSMPCLCQLLWTLLLKGHKKGQCRWPLPEDVLRSGQCHLIPSHPTFALYSNRN